MALYLWLRRAAHLGALQVVKVVLLASRGIVLREPGRGPLRDDAAVQLAARRSAAANERIQSVAWGCTATKSLCMSPSLTQITIVIKQGQKLIAGLTG